MICEPHFEGPEAEGRRRSGVFRGASPKVTQAAGAIWDLVVAGQKSVKDALNEIKTAVDPIIAENK